MLFNAARYRNLGQAAVLMVLAGVGLTMLLRTEIYRLTCTPTAPTQGLCTIQAHSLGGGQRPVATITDLRQADLETTRGSRGRSSYRLWLTTATGQRYQITPSKPGRIDVQQDAARINDYVANGQSYSLTIGPRSRLGSYLLLGSLATGLGAMGIFNLLYQVAYRSTFDRSRGQLTIDCCNWLGQPTQTTYRLNAIKRAELREQKGSKGRLYYITHIHLAGQGTPVDLITDEPRDDQNRAVESINQFLGR